MIDLIVYSVIPTALSMLPPSMDSLPARAMLIAIGLQESKFLERRQGGGGPARGFWQFEKGGGVRGVLEHPTTTNHAIATLRRLRYPTEFIAPGAVHPKLEDNDLLACVFARLLIYTVPARLPTRTEPSEGWRQYLEAWRPGKPHPSTWAAYFGEAWERVTVAHGNLPRGETP